MKILVCAFASNDKFPISLQYEQFKKHVTEPFEYVLFNDTVTAKESDALEAAANKIGIRCIRIPQEIHKCNNPSQGYASALNWAANYLKSEEIVVFVHADIFPVHNVSITEIIGESDIASTIEQRCVGSDKIIYLYPALTFLNMKKVDLSLLDFSCRRGPGLGETESINNVGLDTGGMSHVYIQRKPDNVKFLENHDIANVVDRLKPEHPKLAEYFDKTAKLCSSSGIPTGWYANGFFHYIAGSQWNASSIGERQKNGHARKLDRCIEFFGN